MQNHFKNSIVYYYKHLVDNGCSDPLKVLIKDFLDTVEVSKEQRDFILSTSGENEKILTDVLTLISKTKATGVVVDKEIKVIESSLKYILNKK